MNVDCYDCEAQDKGTKDQLTDKGWMGAEVDIKDKEGKEAHIKFQLCPIHAKGERFVEIINIEGDKLGVQIR